MSQIRLIGNQKHLRAPHKLPISLKHRSSFSRDRSDDLARAHEVEARRTQLRVQLKRSAAKTLKQAMSVSHTHAHSAASGVLHMFDVRRATYAHITRLVHMHKWTKTLLFVPESGERVRARTCSNVSLSLTVQAWRDMAIERASERVNSCARKCVTVPS